MTYEVFLTSNGRVIKTTQSLSVARILASQPGYDYDIVEAERRA